MSNKHIFVSQGTLNYSRNRAQRRLERELDNQGNGSSIPLTNLDTGEGSKITHTNFTTFQKSSPVYNCPYWDNCNVRKFGHINCLTENSIKTCQTYKYYERYKGLDINQLGI